MSNINWKSIGGVVAIIIIAWLICGCLLTILTGFIKSGNTNQGVYKKGNSTIIDKTRTTSFDKNDDIII